MLGSAVFRTGVAPGGALAGPWVRNPLWTAARAVPSLDLRFAENKSLVDATTGQNLVTFTRASSGTYVDSQGVIQRATTNLLLRSEEFDDSVWGKVGGSVTANAITAPNGQTTADLFTENTVLTQHDVRVTSPTLTDGVTYTLTVYSKTNGRRLNIIYPLDTAGHGATFDLINGTFTYTGNTVTATIQPVGDGWYRCSCTATKSGGSGTSQLRFLTHNGTTNNYTGDGTSGIYLWGAQLEQSSTVGEYIPTTSTINSAPRFDHSPTTGESLGLLVEESRTNFVTQSETFAGWSITGLTQTTASVTNPAGNTGGQLFTEDTTTSTHRLFLAPTTGQTVQSFTIWAKLASGSRLFYIESDNASGTRRTLRFNLQTGAVDNNPGDWSNVFITRYPGGWFRLGGTITDNGGSTLFIVGSSNGASASYAGDGASGFYIWGAQLEAGAFPTSYIPTTTATVTRSADVASISGSNFSSWYRQDEGTVFAETQLPAGTAVNTSSRSIIDATDGSTNNRVSLRAIASGATADQLTVRSGAATVAQFGSTGTTVSSLARKIAAVYRLDDYASWATGAVTAATDTSGALPVGVNQITVGSAVGGNEFMSGTIRRLTYWPRRLPNETLQGITQ